MGKKENFSWVFNSIVDLENVKPTGFLLKKATHGRYLDAFKLKSVRTSYFRKKLMLEINRVKEKYESGDLKITDFDKDDTEDENVITILDVDKLSSIKNTIDQIFQQSESNPIDSLKSMERAKFSAMLFDMPDGKSLIAIDSVSIFDKNAFEKGGLVATYDDLGVQELGKDSVLIFRFGLPCIYFEEKKKLLVINKAKTEQIFNLLEHYQQRANEKFEELESNMITVDDGVLQSELKNITIARRINNMIESQAFPSDIQFYKRHEEFIKQNGLDDELTQIFIKDGRVMIDSHDRFKSFLHITSLNIVNPVIDPQQYFVAFRKRKIKTIPKKTT